MKLHYVDSWILQIACHGSYLPGDFPAIISSRIHKLVSLVLPVNTNNVLSMSLQVDVLLEVLILTIEKG